VKAKHATKPPLGGGRSGNWFTWQNFRKKQKKQSWQT